MMNLQAAHIVILYNMANIVLISHILLINRLNMRTWQHIVPRVVQYLSSLKNSIAYNQTLRVKTICSTEDEYQLWNKNLFERKYNDSFSRKWVITKKVAF